MSRRTAAVAGPSMSAVFCAAALLRRLLACSVAHTPNPASTTAAAPSATAAGQPRRPPGVVSPASDWPGLSAAPSSLGALASAPAPVTSMSLSATGRVLSAGRQGTNRDLAECAELPPGRRPGQRAVQAALLGDRRSAGRGDGDLHGDDDARRAGPRVQRGERAIQDPGGRDRLRLLDLLGELCPAELDLGVQRTGRGLLPQRQARGDLSVIQRVEVLYRLLALLEHLVAELRRGGRARARRAVHRPAGPGREPGRQDGKHQGGGDEGCSHLASLAGASLASGAVTPPVADRRY